MKKIRLLLFSVIPLLFFNDARAQLFGTDVKVYDLPITNEHNPDVDVAFNGWAYDAYAIDTGFVLRVSRDSGQTWSTIDEYSGDDAHIQHVKLAVASVGTDTTSIRVFLMVLENDSVDFIGQIYINSYDGYADSFIAQNFYRWLPDNAYQNIDIACDYKYPSVASSPYSIAAAYTVDQVTDDDSVIYVVSTDGGETYGNQFTFDVSSVNHYRNVSIAYGRSFTAANGRYFLAWDEFSNNSDEDGRIFEAYTNTNILDAPTSRYRLDTVGALAGGLARRPCISVSANNTNNDSGSCTAIVAFERDINGDGSNIDVIAAYNKRAHFTNYWNKLNIDIDADIDQAPNVCFEPVNSNFYLTYFDSSNKRIAVIRNSFNLLVPTWGIITNNCADDSLVLTIPNPIVGIDPTRNTPVMTWAAPLILNNVVLYDAQLSNWALAIKTAAITATNSGTRNRIDWRTATEEAGSAFIIERSTDGMNFAAIGSENGKGSASDYTYWDETPASGMNYYRLRTKDASGSISYTKVVSAFVKGGNTFSVVAYPNPVLNSVNLYRSGDEATNATVSISDLSGRILLHKAVNTYETVIDMSSLATGIYLLKYSDDSHNEVIRISKQ